MPVLLEEDMRLPLPSMHRVVQTFSGKRLEDAAATVARELCKPEIRQAIRPGMRVAVAVGSRGIRSLSRIVKCTVEAVLARGADPFIVTAMGSHGEGTPEGQREILASYGVTEEAMGVPVVSDVDVDLLGTTPSGVPVYFDRAARDADLVIPINRIKLHTDFVSDIQSGLCKMLAVGLGNHKGCSTLHEVSFDRFGQTIVEAAELILAEVNVGFGVGIVENAYDETALIEAIPADRLIRREKELVRVAKANMPALLIPEIDVLIVEQIGKNISGAGYDPNILGKSYLLKEFVLEVPRIKRMVLLDLTPETHGNAIGMGIFDVITRQVFQKLDLDAMYANAVAVKCPEDAKIPILAQTEDEAVRIAIKVARGCDPRRPKIVRIKNTLELGTIEVSEALVEYAGSHSRLRLE